MIAASTLRNHPFYSIARRLISYSIWTIGAFSLPLIVDRFFINPLLASELGAEKFGDFIWLISIVYLLVMAINSGYGNTLQREYDSTDHQYSESLVGTTLLLTLYTSIPTFIATGIITFYFDKSSTSAIYYFYLFSYGVGQCLLWIFLTYSRIQRYFKFVFTLKAVEALGLYSMAIFVEHFELWLVALFYLFSTTLAIALSVWFYSFKEKKLPHKWSGVVFKKIVVSAPSFAASSFVEYLSTYAPRILLGLMDGSSSITFLFVATSTANIFILPVTIGASLLLSLLAGKDKFFNSLRAGLLYLLFVIFLSFIVYGVSYFLGFLFIDYLYPQLSQKSLEIYKWIALSNIFFTISLLIRSVLIRYSSLRVIIMLPTYSMIIMLLSLVFLIPTYGVMGAVIAIVVTAALHSILSIFYYMRYCYSLNPKVASELNS